MDPTLLNYILFLKDSDVCRLQTEKEMSGKRGTRYAIFVYILWVFTEKPVVNH